MMEPDWRAHVAYRGSRRLANCFRGRTYLRRISPVMAANPRAENTHAETLNEAKPAKNHQSAIVTGDSTH